MNILHVVILVELAFIVILFLLALHFRRRYETIKLNFKGPLKSQWTRDFDARFRETELGPTLDAEATLVGAGTGSFGSTSDTEAWVLGCLARNARQVFEFGTATGRTTYILAKNAHSEGKVTTITLSPDELAAYTGESSDSSLAVEKALLESRYSAFLYQGTDVEDRVEQLYGDSKQLDESPYLGRCELIFIDGAHTYSYIRSDSEKALRMVKPGGFILWHDYRGRHVRPTRDVYRYLNELSQRLPLTHLRGTSLVAYRAPLDTLDVSRTPAPESA